MEVIMGTLRTRPPTGRPAWPLVLVEGEEKAGKTYVSLALSASEHIGRTFVFDLGDGTADEYAALGRYEVVELNGTYTDLLEQVRAAVAVPAEDGRPNLYVLDSGTQLWDALKAWTDGRARQSKKGRAALQDDPDAEIDPTMNLWNDAKDRWQRIVNELRKAPGIAVITAQGTEVAKVENGQPVMGQTTWSVLAEKTLPAAVTAWVRMRRDPRSATLIGARSLHVDVPPRGLPLPLDGTLEHLVFDVLGSGAAFATPSVARATVGIPVKEAKNRVLRAVKQRHEQLTGDEQVELTRRYWHDAGLPDAKDADEVSAEQLADLLSVIAADEPAQPAGEPESAAEDAPATTTADAAPDAPADEGAADGGNPAGPLPEQPTLDDVMALNKRQAVAVLHVLGLSTAGTVAELRDRIAGEYELLPEPSAQAEADAAMDAGADGPDLGSAA